MTDLTDERLAEMEALIQGHAKWLPLYQDDDLLATATALIAEVKRLREENSRWQEWSGQSTVRAEQADDRAEAAEAQLARYRAVVEDQRSLLHEFRTHVLAFATQWKMEGGSHHHPIWARVANAIDMSPHADSCAIHDAGECNCNSLADLEKDDG